MLIEVGTGTHSHPLAQLLCPGLRIHGMDRFRNTRQPDWDWWGKLWPAPGETLRELGLETGDSLVEIGSGNGYFALPAARIVDPAPVFALDVDDALLDELARLADSHGIENLVRLHGDARSMTDHLPEAVDVALLANAFHGIGEPSQVTREMVAGLADDGRLVVVNWRSLPREATTVAGDPRGPPTELRLSPEETEARISDATDVRLTETVDIPPYHYGLVFGR